MKFSDGAENSSFKMWILLFHIKKSFLYLHPLRRNGRVVDCGSLENC